MDLNNDKYEKLLTVLICIFFVSVMTLVASTEPNSKIKVIADSIYKASRNVNSNELAASKNAKNDDTKKLAKISTNKLTGKKDEAKTSDSEASKPVKAGKMYAEKCGEKIKIRDEIKELESYKGELERKDGRAKFISVEKGVLKSVFFVYDGDIYHSDKDGYLSTGWEKISDNYYFFNRDNNKMVRNKTVEMVALTKYGVAGKSDYTQTRAKCYAEFGTVVDSLVKPTDSKSVKLKKCYKWIEKMGYNQYRTFKQARSNPNWDIVFANDVYNKHLGCCVSYSCALAIMAVDCGYTDVTICSDTGHVWVDIKGRLYDPLFAESRSFKKNYNAKYTDYRANPAVKRKLS